MSAESCLTASWEAIPIMPGMDPGDRTRDSKSRGSRERAQNTGGAPIRLRSHSPSNAHLFQFLYKSTKKENNFNWDL